VPSTFTSNTGIEKIGDGQKSGLWGQTTNLNFDIIDRALNGSIQIPLAGTTHSLVTSSGALSDGQFAVLVFTGSLGAPNTVSISPQTAQKLYWVRNATNQNVILSQGTGAEVTVPAGTSKVVFTNGGGATAAVFDITNTLAGNLTGNADTATALQTARTIGGVSFDGTSNINLPGVNQVGNQNTTGSAASLTTARLIGGVSFNGTANINLPGVNQVGNQNTTGSAASLTTARLIGGVSFNGTANINLPGVNQAGNQNTSGNAATASRWQTARTITINGISQSVDGSSNVSFTLPQVAGEVPSGGIIMWSGSIANIPSGWLLCNGQNGTPDLRDRFVVGAGSTYAPNATGGANSVTLNTNQIPSHTHGFNATTGAAGGHNHTGTTSTASLTGNINFAPSGIPNHSTSGVFSSSGSANQAGFGAGSTPGQINLNASHNHSFTTSSVGNHNHSVSGTTNATGGGQSHENRPPYFALAYIMKA